MALKPTEKPAWVSGDEAARIKEPSGSKKLTGFVKSEQPPFNFLNWLFNILSHWLNFFAGNAQYNVIIDSDSDEQDYASMAAYIADSPAAGDRILIKVDEVIAATMSIPAGIEITQQKGKKFIVNSNMTDIIIFGDNVVTKGEITIENNDTGTIARGFRFNGDNNAHNSLIIKNLSTGIIANAFQINTSKVGNYSQCQAINSGAGSITIDLTDNSTNDLNHVTVKGDAGISRSNGAKKFDAPDIDDLTNLQHNHLNTVNGGPLNKPSFRVNRNNVDQTIPHNTPTKVEWTTEVFDTNSDFDNVTNFRFTPSVAGKYLLTATVMYKTMSPDPATVIIDIRKNGASNAEFRDQSLEALESISVSIVVDANGTTDFFEVFISHIESSGQSSEDIHGSILFTYFSGCKID